MKKKIAIIATAILLLGVTSTSVVNANPELRSTPSSTFGILDDSSVSPMTSFANALVLLDKNLFRKFDKAFPSASNASWYREGKKTKFYFNQGNRIIRTSMNDRGHFDYMIQYYPATELPEDVAQAVQNEFKGYVLDKVTEVSIDEKNAYVIIIKGMRDWLKVKFLDGEVTVMNTFTYDH
ncbi:hypothetical protein MD537_14670 [Flavihumibacter sediminis]|nr:hypothetical protein [Flavihumibacter sediminis]